MVCKECRIVKFLLSSPYFVGFMEVMNGKHPEIRDLDKIHIDGCDLKPKKETTSYIKALTCFPFIIGLITLYSLFHLLAGLTDSLQGRIVSNLKVYKEKIIVRHILRCRRIPKPFLISHIYMSLALLSTYQFNLLCQKLLRGKKNSNNPEVSSSEDYFRNVLAIPALQRVNFEIDSTFSKFMINAFKIL